MIGLLAAAFVLLAATGVVAQPAEPDSPDTPELEAEVVTGSGTVDVNVTPSDARIQRRLTEILEATDRFETVRVEVRDGVVFLSGTANNDASRKLATDLATRTDGVAAVVNNLTLPRQEIWTLDPAIAEVQELLRLTVRATPLMLVGIVILLVSLVLAGAISRLGSKLLTRSTGSELLQNVVRKGLFLAVLIVGLYLALRVTGLTRIALTIVSGTGLLGLALGFAFRDIAENFLASILLSIQRPFQLGDVVEVDGHLGIVRKVTSRGTLLIDFDGNHIQIANSTVYKNTIKNFTANPLIRINFTVGIGYDDHIAKAQDIVRHLLDEHPAVLNDPEPLVLVEQLGSSTVNLRVYFWIDGTQHSMLKLKSSVIRLTVGALSEAGVSMPDEAREVIFPRGVPVRMVEAKTDQSIPSGQEPQLAGAAEPEPAQVKQSEEVVVEAEGDLTVETDELNRQADRARDPEEGTNVLSPTRK